LSPKSPAGRPATAASSSESATQCFLCLCQQQQRTFPQLRLGHRAGKIGHVTQNSREFRTRKLGHVTRKLKPVTCKLGPVTRKLGLMTRKLGPVTRKLGTVIRKLGPMPACHVI